METLPETFYLYFLRNRVHLVNRILFGVLFITCSDDTNALAERDSTTEALVM